MDLRRHGLLALAVLLSLSISACGGEPDWEARLNRIIADTEASAEQKVQQLEDFLADEPPLQQASEARFTIGWLYAETLHQYQQARRWFTELVEKSPQSQWAENAQWMIDNMEKDPSELLPQLRQGGEPPPE
jgi:predicted Zn-dependent protease